MAAANTITGTEIQTSVNYELRNTGQVQFIEAEVLQYINKWYEIIYFMLAQYESDLVSTGSGNFVTVAGTERYDLSDNSMGDLWSIPQCDDAGDSNVRLSALGGIEIVPMSDRTSHLIAKDQGTSQYNQPSGFYIWGDWMGLLPFPDAVYTVYIENYIPNFIPLALIGSTMPFKNLFNGVIKQGLLITAKGRENYGNANDAAVMEIIKDSVMTVLRQRSKSNMRFE